MTSDHASESAQSSPRAGRDYFVTTRWTEVLSAGRSNTPRAREALAALCQAYWYPLYAYVRRSGYDSHDAEDLTQGFFARLLKLHSLAEVTPERGKFRAFLLASMKNHLRVEWDRASAQKRDIRQTFSLDMDTAETRYQHEAAPGISSELVFDRQWALTLLDKVVQQLRGEYEASGRAAIFHELRHAITLGKDLLPVTEASTRLGMTEEAIRVAVHRLRKRYRQMLRDEIATTVADDSEVDAEMDYLRRVIASS